MTDCGDGPRRLRRPVAIDDATTDVNTDGNLPEAVEDRFYGDFISVANSVAELFHIPTWAAFTKSAIATTRFYKSANDAHRQGFEKGTIAGRQMLTREILSWMHNQPYTYLKKDDLEALLMSRQASVKSHSVIVSPVEKESLLTNNNNNNNNQTTPSPVKEHTGMMLMFNEALRVPNDLGEFFQQACYRNSKRRITTSHGDECDSVRKRARR
ncbi:hypothetical protein T4E_7915 [Trichinella pseudospiralis]|uniref:Uncharacterized protein n=1 Tax=Trichinella pseudospiralis TaxID=6337 RepID=A0A0V0XI92_TRIPS|nr:hypothetical protein T4E_7915 [Trichinella pseudospiralis]